MVMTRDKKEQVIKDFQKSNSDTGSSEVQIALLTKRINELTDHFKAHVKDHHSRYGLIKMVTKRKKLLKYLKNNQLEKYEEVIKKLNLRK